MLLKTISHKHTFFKYLVFVHFVHGRRPFSQNKQKNNTKQNLQIHIDAREQVRQRWLTKMKKKPTSPRSCTFSLMKEFAIFFAIAQLQSSHLHWSRDGAVLVLANLVRLQTSESCFSTRPSEFLMVYLVHLIYSMVCSKNCWSIIWKIRVTRMN